MNHSYTSHKGFTLVELSIVLVIIGLIVSGVLAGKSLIRSVKLNSIIKDIESYKTAIKIFELKYDGALVGDFDEASLYGLGSDGDGDQIIYTCSSEGLYAWQHLGNAKLISGQYTGVPNAGAVKMILDENIPSASIINVGYMFTHVGKNSNCMGFNDKALFGNIDDKNLIVAGLSTTDYSAAGSTVVGFLTVQEAYVIDKKVDNGEPDTGIVIASNNANDNVNGSRCVDNNIQGTGGANFDWDETGEDCHLFFVLLQ